MQRLKIRSLPELGDESSDVRTLQVRLIELGYDPGPVDGKFGNRTRVAVKAFQVRKLSGRTFDDGSVGLATAEALGLYIDPSVPETKAREFITKDLQGKKDRKVMPELRAMIEDRVFPGGLLSKAFIEHDLIGMACEVAEALESMKIREVGGNNRGKIVGLIQSVIGGVAPGGNGLSWCIAIDQVIIAFIEDYLQMESPVPASLGVTETFQLASKIPGLTAKECERGTICCAQHGTSWKGHAMFVMTSSIGNLMSTFEGNTNSEGSRDGDGAYFKTRDKYKNGDLTTLGFLRIYPNNEVPK